MISGIGHCLSLSVEATTAAVTSVSSDGSGTYPKPRTAGQKILKSLSMPKKKLVKSNESISRNFA